MAKVGAIKRVREPWEKRVRGRGEARDGEEDITCPLNALGLATLRKSSPNLCVAQCEHGWAQGSSQGQTCASGDRATRSGFGRPNIKPNTKP